MKGVELVSAELSPEISPTWTLEDNSAEWQFLKSVRLVGGSGQEGAVAAELGTFRINNPAGSGVLCSVNFLALTPGGATNVHARIFNVEAAALTDGISTGPLDTRWNFPGTVISPVIFSAQTQVAVISGGVLIWNSTTNTNMLQQITMPIVLAPNSHLDIQAQTVNSSQRIIAHWHERGVSALELP